MKAVVYREYAPDDDYAKMVEKKGRVLTKQGTQKLDKLATEILSELIKKEPGLKIYS